MKRSGPIKRYKRLPRSTKPIPKQGKPERKARRKKQTRDLHKTPEYLAVRAEAMERAGGRCEYVLEIKVQEGRTVFFVGPFRCTETDTPEHPLHCHLESYGAVGKLKAERAKMYCYRHHMLVESQLRPQNKNRLGRAS